MFSTRLEVVFSDDKDQFHEVLCVAMATFDLT